MSLNSAAPPADRRRWLMLAVVLAAMFMAIFDFYVINIATPSLQTQLKIGDSALELVIGGYTFTYASLLVTGGRWGDIFSYRRMFMIGMGLFTVASLFCGVAQNGSQLVAVRLIQGIGAALMVPQVVAFITVTFAPAERPRALSWFGATIGLAVVSAQILGGALLSADVAGLGWRIIFLVNVPIGLVTLVLAARLLPEAKAPRRPRQDVIGNIGISAALGLAILPVILGRTEHWPVWGWVMLAVSVPVAVATVLYERRLPERGGEPMLDLALFKDRSYGVGIAVTIGMMAFYAGFIFGMTIFLQFGLGLSPLRAGLTFGPMGVGFAFSSLSARSMLKKYGGKVIVVGQALLLLSPVVMLIALRSGTKTSAWELVGPMVLAGMGAGLSMPALTGVVMSKVQPQRAGVASGLLTTAQQFANTIGVAVFGVLFFNALGSGHATRADYVHALTVVGVGDILVSVATLTGTLFLPRGPMGPPPGAKPPGQAAGQAPGQQASAPQAPGAQAAPSAAATSSGTQ